jgi:hypothetical protein
MSNALRRVSRLFLLLRTAWSIFGITLILLLAAEAGFRLAFGFKDWLSSEVRPNRQILDEGYNGATWPVRHYRELEEIEDRWQPYVYFRQKPFRGETITVGPDGLRATWQPPQAKSESGSAERRPLKLLLLGGSSLWGFGARDDQTIPSHVARLLYERGWNAQLKNLAEIGYVSTQEAVALYRELQSGYRPDVVIFYDGVNDTTSALLEGDAGLSTNEINRRREFNLSRSPARLARALGAKVLEDSGSYRFASAIRRHLPGRSAVSRPATPPEALRERSQRIVDLYQGNVAVVRALGRCFNFQPLFFWQPDVFAKSNLHPLEQREAASYAWAEPIFREVHGRVRGSAVLQADSAFRDLSQIFGDSRHLSFIDFCHTTESANLQIASAIVDDVIRIILTPAPDLNDAGHAPLR